ncbi:MAG: transcription elongation protein SprT [Bacteroidetes bacterium]|nr:transcription elongation protein SprT [Bacteroidota bacterium]
MPINTLEQFIPEQGAHFLRKWIVNHSIHFKITRNRLSKLGDYRKLTHGHQITINGSLDKELFFFVLTHELAHLIAREKYGPMIAPHGNEWKSEYRTMLHESLAAYSENLQPLLVRFAKSPKANFMASSEMVDYFLKDQLKNEEFFLKDLDINHNFIFRNQKYCVIKRRKKNYLCKNLTNGKEYIFQPLASVQKI